MTEFGTTVCLPSILPQLNYNKIFKLVGINGTIKGSRNTMDNEYNRNRIVYFLFPFFFWAIIWCFFLDWIYSASRNLPMQLCEKVLNSMVPILVFLVNILHLGKQLMGIRVKKLEPPRWLNSSQSMQFTA